VAISQAPSLSVGAIPLTLGARLVGVPVTRIRGWVFGHPKSGQLPIIQHQLEPVGGRYALGFLDLLEAKFIGHFRSRNIKISVIRRVANRLRRDTNYTHPFLAKNVRFRSGLNRIFMEEADEEGEKHLTDLLHGQRAIFHVLDELLDEGLEFGQSDMSQRWKPRADFPEIVVDPRLSLGQPVLQTSAIPTRAVYEAAEVEESEAAVARWFDIPEAHVVEAVKFEINLKRL